MREADKRAGIQLKSTVGNHVEAAINAIIILIGLFFLSAGTYVSVQSIIDEFTSGSVSGVFSCANDGI